MIDLFGLWRRSERTVMSLNYRETDDECPGCGATARGRRDNKPNSPQGLSECPQCGAEKCCMCDMGDDVECASCDLGDE